MKNILKFSLIPLLLQAQMGQAALTVTHIAPGSTATHSLFLKSDGSLWAMGFNAQGELGDGTFNVTNRPEQIVPSEVTAIAAGNVHSLFLKSDGSLWGMGVSGDGELGDGGAEYSTNQPERIVTNGVTAIAAGYYSSLFLKSDGSLWAMGDNGYGELGDGTFNSAYYPEQIVASNVTAIALGRYHSLFLKSDGSLWAMGDNEYGQLGDGTYGDPASYRSTNMPEQIVASNVTAIAAGYVHSLFLKSDGSLWAMGLNQEGQLGDGTFITTNQPELIVASNVTAIAAGGLHSLFLKSDGSLWGMGDEGIGNPTNQPEQIVTSGVTAIVSGFEHSLFLKSDGSLWAIGINQDGQLGDGFDDYASGGGTAIPEQIFPVPEPRLDEAISSGSNLQFTATCGFGSNFYLLGSTNVTVPLSQWMPLLTNSVTYRGTNNFSLILTNAVAAGGQQFYILQSK